MKSLYIEPIFGLSGDMLLSALIDIGFDANLLEREMIKLLNIDIKIEVRKKKSKNFTGKNLKMIWDDRGERKINDIKRIIEKSKFSDYVKSSSIKAFEYLAEVEAKIHNTSKERVHFHELSGIDTIIDIVGYFLALQTLQIDNVFVGPIPLGYGVIEGAHGIMPSPAFATLELLSGFQIYGIPLEGENITPTAATLLKTSAKSSTFPSFTLEKVGYGCGNLSFKNYPNLTRVSIGTSAEETNRDEVLSIDFNVDDLTGEILGYLSERLMEGGALDVSFSPIFMKKGRPAYKVNVIVSSFNFKKILNIIFAETTTLGIRYSKTDRIILERRIEKIETSLGIVGIKKAFFNGKVRFKLEYEDIKNIAIKEGMPLKDVMKAVNDEIDKKIIKR